MSGWDKASILIVFAFLLVVFVIVYPKEDSYIEKEGSLIWRQPFSVDALYSEKISSKYWSLDFEAMERALFRIKFNKAGEVKLSSNTSNALERLMTRFPSGMDADLTQRVHLLIAEVYPGDKGKSVARLVMNFHDFYLAQQVLEKEKPVESGVLAAEARFYELVKLKETYLGKAVSDTLFAEQHALALYIFERRKINADKSLTEEDRKLRFKRLDDEYASKLK